MKTLIDTSVTNVAAGGKLARQAGTSMEAIVQGVGHVVDILNDIRLSATEQSHAIEQVTPAVGQLDRMPQENAAAVEETRLPRTNSNQALHMSSLMGAFQLRKHRHRNKPALLAYGFRA